MTDTIARCKRILNLVDDYHENPTADNRTALRKALMDELEPKSEQARDMAMLIKKLSHAHNKAAPGNTVSARAVAYLTQHDLLGTPLR